MKIKEIVENIDLNSERIKQTVYSLFNISSKSIIEVETKMIDLSKNPNKNLKNELWTKLLVKLDSIIESFEKSVLIYLKYHLEKNTFDEQNYSETLSDIINMKEHIQSLRKKLPKSLSENIIQ